LASCRISRHIVTASGAIQVETGLSWRGLSRSGRFSYALPVIDFNLSTTFALSRVHQMFVTAPFQNLNRSFVRSTFAQYASPVALYTNSLLLSWPRQPSPRRISDREVASSIPGCSVAIGATLDKLFTHAHTHTHMCLCSPSSITWYRLRLGVKCTT